MLALLVALGMVGHLLLGSGTLSTLLRGELVVRLHSWIRVGGWAAIGALALVAVARPPVGAGATLVASALVVAATLVGAAPVVDTLYRAGNEPHEALRTLHRLAGIREALIATGAAAAALALGATLARRRRLVLVAGVALLALPGARLALSHVAQSHARDAAQAHDAAQVSSRLEREPAAPLIASLVLGALALGARRRALVAAYIAWELIQPGALAYWHAPAAALAGRVGWPEALALAVALVPSRAPDDARPRDDR